MPAFIKFDKPVNHIDAARNYKKKFTGGNGAITTWVGHVGMPTPTSYQDTYTTRTTAQYKMPVRDLNTSLVGRMSPDPFALLVSKDRFANRRASSTFA